MAVGEKRTAIMSVRNATDGHIPVLNTDGQLKSSEKTTADFAPAPLTKNITLYVNAATGSDSNDGLSAEKPKQTIQAAINQIPKLLQGGSVKINLADGTYDENVTLVGFTGANHWDESIQIVGAGTESTILNGYVQTYNDTSVLFQDFKINSNDSASCISALGGGACRLYNMTLQGGIYGLNSARAVVYARNAVMNGASKAGLQFGGIAFLYNVSVKNCPIGIQAGNGDAGIGGLVVLDTLTNVTADTKYKKVYGGAIIENGVLV